MKAHMKIGTIPILFEYQFEDYFKNQLDKYQDDIDEVNSYLLKVQVVSTFNDLIEGKKLFFENKVKISTTSHIHIFSYDQDKSIKYHIRYTHDYKEIIISLNQSLDTKLAEYEYVLSGMMFFEIAIQNQYLPIHASALFIKDRAVLLTGPSKSGKSTQTKFVLEANTKIQIINEDKPLIYEVDECLYVCGSPWSGKHVINQNIEAKLTDIIIIKKAKDLSIRELNYQEKMKELLRNIHRSGVKEHVDHTVKLLEKVISTINIVSFECINDILSGRYLIKYLEDSYED